MGRDHWPLGGRNRGEDGQARGLHSAEWACSEEQLCPMEGVVRRPVAGWGEAPRCSRDGPVWPFGPTAVAQQSQTENTDASLRTVPGEGRWKVAKNAIAWLLPHSNPFLPQYPAAVVKADGLPKHHSYLFPAPHSRPLCLAGSH